MIGFRLYPALSPVGCLLLAVFFLQGCSALAPRRGPEEIARQTEAERLLNRFATRNEKLKSVKGIGSVRLEQPGERPISGRLAWVAKVPAKIRFAFLVSGHPVMVFAADGRNIYFVDPRAPEESYRKIRSSDGRLDRLVAMPVRTSDLVALLVGRIPLLEHSEVMLQIDPETGARILVLERWWTALEKIYIDRDGDSIKRIDFLERSGDLRYRVEYLQVQMVQGFTVPRRLKISNDEGAVLILGLDRYQLADSAEDEVFTIAPPDELQPG